MEHSLFIVDGSSYIFRAFFGVRAPLTSKDGTPTNAVYGFKNMLSNLLTNHEPTHVVMVFDPSGKTHRHDIYPDYKANRAKAPDDLVPQFALIHELTRMMNLPVIIMDGVEADDVIGSLVEKFQSEANVSIVSSDKDLTQLITDNVYMIDTMKNVKYNEELVLEKYGVYPSQIAEYLALTGDSSDNIPGATGIGPKGAAELLKQYGDLKTLEENLSEIKGKKGEKLINSWPNVKLSFELTTINRHIEIPHTLEEFMRVEPDLSRMRELYTELNFRSDKLVDMMPAADDDPLHGTNESIKVAPANNLEKKSEYKLINTEETLGELVESIKKNKEYAFDLETTGLDYLTDHIVGIAVSTRDFPGCYIPIKHTPESMGDFPQLDSDHVLGIFKELLTDPSLKVICHNIKFERHVLREHGVEISSPHEDTMLISYVLNSHLNSHSLDKLALEHFGHSMIEFSSVTGGKKSQMTFDMVPIEQACEYASEDTDYTYKLYDFFQPELEKNELTSIYNEVELPLAAVLCKMESYGVKINQDYFGELSENFTGEVKIYEEKIYEEAGEEFNINSPKQLGEILFTKLGITDHKKQNKTGLSTDASVLEKLSHKHKIANLIIKFRTLNKLLNTYVDVLPNLTHQKTGRIHTSYNQSVAATGRLSSSHPNLQNIPIKGEEGSKIRKGFIVEDGYKMVSIDYSQIELRILAHLTGDPALINAFRENKDIHNQTASLILGVPESNVTPDQRRVAKSINFGIIYGMSAFRLANETGIANAHAKDFIDSYFEYFPKITDYISETIQSARKNEYVTTILGRRRHMPDINNKNANLRKRAERMAVNTTVQGSAADLIKVAMIRVDQFLTADNFRSRMIMQVHDELIFEVFEPELDELLPKIYRHMEKAIALNVPLAVSTGIGLSWAEAHD